MASTADGKNGPGLLSPTRRTRDVGAAGHSTLFGMKHDLQLPHEVGADRFGVASDTPSVHSELYGLVGEVRSVHAGRGFAEDTGILFQNSANARRNPIHVLTQADHEARADLPCWIGREVGQRSAPDLAIRD